MSACTDIRTISTLTSDSHSPLFLHTIHLILRILSYPTLSTCYIWYLWYGLELKTNAFCDLSSTSLYSVTSLLPVSLLLRHDQPSECSAFRKKMLESIACYVVLCLQYLTPSRLDTQYHGRPTDSTVASQHHEVRSQGSGSF